MSAYSCKPDSDPLILKTRTETTSVVRFVARLSDMMDLGTSRKVGTTLKKAPSNFVLFSKILPGKEPNLQKNAVFGHFFGTKMYRMYGTFMLKTTKKYCTYGTFVPKSAKSTVRTVLFGSFPMNLALSARKYCMYGTFLVKTQTCQQN